LLAAEVLAALAAPLARIVVGSAVLAAFVPLVGTDFAAAALAGVALAGVSLVVALAALAGTALAVDALLPVAFAVVLAAVTLAPIALALLGGAVLADLAATFVAGPLAAPAFFAGAFFAAGFATDAVAVVLDARGLAAALTGSALPPERPLPAVLALFDGVCAGMALFEAFRTASARSAMAFPHTCKTGARRGAAHSEDGKNTEPTVPRQTCHTLTSRIGYLVRICHGLFYYVPVHARTVSHSKGLFGQSAAAGMP